MKKKTPILKQKEKQKASPSVKAVDAKPKRALPFIPPFVVLLLMLWIFAGMIYGDVFYMAEQHSFFAFDPLLMKNVTDQSNGWLVMVGRFFLLSYHIPVLGGLLWALVITSAMWMLGYALQCTGYLRLIPLVLPFLFAVYVMSKGLNLYYQFDPHWLFSYPLVLWCIALVAALVVRLVTHRHIPSLLRDGSADTSRQRLTIGCSLLVLFVALMIDAVPFHVNERATATMQRQLQEQDWDAMLRTAEGVKRPGRTVACYRAIALSQTGQISSRLFDTHYQYPDLGLKNRAGQVDNGTEYYAADGDFYAGLINTSYHESMERTVIDGITVYRLKRMFLCALLNNERQLAYKYYTILSHHPLEGKFLSKYGPMMQKSDAILEEPNFRLVAELMPVDDSFEQWYRTPYFIGYNIMLTAGRSRRALENSLVACLYAKELTAFYQRTAPLQGESLPQSFDEALAMIGIKDGNSLQPYVVTPLSTERVRSFLRDAVQYKGQDRKEVYYELSPKYQGYYPFYYYFQNIPDKNYMKYDRESGRVN